MAIETVPHAGAKGKRYGPPPGAGLVDEEPGAILALDLGTKTGWALRQADGQITSGTVEFRAGRFEGGGMPFLRFKGWLDDVLGFAAPLERVVFEEVRRHLGTHAAHAYGGFLAHLTAWCEAHGIPYQGIPVGTIKKKTAGVGNANKEMMIQAVRELGFQPADDNEADALAILHLMIQKEGR